MMLWRGARDHVGTNLIEFDVKGIWLPILHRVFVSLPQRISHLSRNFIFL